MLPIFFSVVLGIVEFGRAMSVSQLVTNASREGARRAIVDGSSNAVVKTYIEDFLTSTLDVDAADLTIQFFVNGSEVDVNTAGENDKVRVHIEVGFDDVLFISTPYLSGSTLKGSTTMRHE